MLVEKKLTEALKDYDKGKKVLVLMTMCDGSIACEKMEELFPEDTHFLVDVPAYENPEFKAEVDIIAAGSDDPRPEPESEMVKDTKPAKCKNFVGGGTKQKECP